MKVTVVKDVKVFILDRTGTIRRIMSKGDSHVLKSDENVFVSKGNSKVVEMSK